MKFRKLCTITQILGLILAAAVTPVQARTSVADIDQKLDTILEDLQLIKGALGLIGPSQITISDFGPGATTYDFDTLPCASGLPTLVGVSLSSPNSFNGLAGPTDSPPTGCANWGSISAPGRYSVYFDGLTIDPDAAITRIGFVFGSNVAASTSVELIRDSAVVATFTISTAGGPPDGVNNWAFFGYQDFAGIDAVVIGETSGSVVGIYDLIIE